MSAFGIREVCHCVFTSKDESKHPSFVIDTAKMSSLESASTTVYAQGGSGNSRLMAWEGEKTLTFTIEDALITPESFRALTGATGSDNLFKIYPTSFAGYYSITAYTLFREQETGTDKVTTITIPNAKLQTQLNLSMSPTGDPSTFTFTFDAMPDSNGADKNLMFSMEIGRDLETDESLSDLTSTASTTTVTINGKSYKMYNDRQKAELTYDVAKSAITIGNPANEVTVTVKTGEIFTDLESKYNIDGSTTWTITLTQGSATRWYII